MFSAAILNYSDTSVEGRHGLFGKKAARAAPYDPEKARLTRNLHEAEARHLEVLRREVANLIVELDPI